MANEKDPAWFVQARRTRHFRIYLWLHVAGTAGTAISANLVYVQFASLYLALPFLFVAWLSVPLFYLAPFIDVFSLFRLSPRAWIMIACDFAVWLVQVMAIRPSVQ